MNAAAPVALNDSERAGRLRRLADLWGAAAVAAAALYFGVRAMVLQWDLWSYLGAAHAVRQGLDPYVLADLTRAVGRSVAYPYLYPPIALVPFLLLAALPASAAAALWIALKLVSLAVLVVIWKRYAVPGTSWFAAALVALFAANASAIADLRCGNVGIVEAVLLWLGFVQFAAGRRRAFAAFVIAAACFKLVPAVYLFLLLVPTAGERSRPGLFFASIAALVALVAVPSLFEPMSHWRGFAASLSYATLLDGPNPSVAAWIEFALQSRIPDPAARTPVVFGLATLYTALVLGASARWLYATWKARDPWRWVVTAVALVLLISPRPMTYSSVVGGGALLALRPSFFRTPLQRVAYACLICAQGVLALVVRPLAHGPILTFMPVIVLLVVWGCALLQTPDAFGDKPVKPAVH